MMKSGNTSISGYWTRDRTQDSVITVVTPRWLYQVLILSRGVTGISTAVITESWVRFPGQYPEIKMSPDFISK